MTDAAKSDYLTIQYAASLTSQVIHCRMDRIGASDPEWNDLRRLADAAARISSAAYTRFRQLAAAQETLDALRAELAAPVVSHAADGEEPGHGYWEAGDY